MQFLKDYIQNTVAQTFNVQWKRKAFYEFVKLFNDAEVLDELKAKVIII